MINRSKSFIQKTFLCAFFEKLSTITQKILLEILEFSILNLSRIYFSSEPKIRKIFPRMTSIYMAR